MQFPCQIQTSPNGRWVVRHDGAALGTVEVMAATREEAMEKMRRELRYRLEFCPCSGEQYGDVSIELLVQ